MQFPNGDLVYGNACGCHYYGQLQAFPYKA